MKRITNLFVCMFTLCAVYGQVGIGTTTPNPNSILELKATNKAFLPPRMTTAQRNAIAAPAQGMTIYNITSDCLNFYRAGGWYDPCATLSALNGRTAINSLLGGGADDIAWSIQQTSDGGFIIAGISSSSSVGTGSGTNHGGGDYLIIKLDVSGNISWSKLLGGSDNEYARCIRQTSDGGYIVAGSSSSSANGNVTASNHGREDYWIVKLDASGNISWNKLLGGSADDFAWSIQQTLDGGYIIAGSSISSASGNVTGVNHGFSGSWNFDCWIIKLDASGSISWNKLMGGNGADYAYGIQQTSDGGYIVGGYSSSSASGDVTSTNHGDEDYWIVKLDALGNILWNKLLGGTGYDQAYSIQQTLDGGYIMAGSSTSSASANVTPNNHGNTDYWIVKLDASGNISWNKLLGGNGFEYGYCIQQTNDGGYIIAGSSTSSANGHVTAASHGAEDYWILKLDASGNITWNKLLGGNQKDLARCIQQTTDGGYIVTGFSTSSANGDVSSTKQGDYWFDYWTLRLNTNGVVIK